jgi:ubiquitin-like modifier-activating enzyme ATG7
MLILYMLGQILDDITSGKVEEDPAVLLRFLVISFADLKNWKVHYNVAFPSLVFNSEMTLLSLRRAAQVLNKEQVMFLCIKYLTTGVSLFTLFSPLIFY